MPFPGQYVEVARSYLANLLDRKGSLLKLDLRIQEQPNGLNDLLVGLEPPQTTEHLGPHHLTGPDHATPAGVADEGFKGVLGLENGEVPPVGEPKNGGEGSAELIVELFEADFAGVDEGTAKEVDYWGGGGDGDEIVGDQWKWDVLRVGDGVSGVGSSGKWKNWGEKRKKQEKVQEIKERFKVCLVTEIRRGVVLSIVVNDFLIFERNRGDWEKGKYMSLNA